VAAENRGAAVSRIIDLYDLCAESFSCAGTRFGGFFFTVFGRRGGFQRAEQPVCSGGYFVNRNKERCFIGLRRFVKTGDLPYELEGRSLNFPGGDWRVKVKKRLDVSAHVLILRDLVCSTVSGKRRNFLRDYFDSLDGASGSGFHT
jgi:hypothetical protein